MLYGGFVWSRRAPSSPILTVDFDRGDTLAVVDPKAMVMVEVNPDLGRRPPDALDVTPELLQKLCREKPKVLVKALLIDPKLIGGIGNAYSDEILWHARISPRSLAGKLPPEAIARLAEATVSVLKSATEHLRKHYPGLLSGEIRDFLAVHNRLAKMSPTGHPIIIEQIASKRTYYTEEQVEYR
jgi:formamidopyrimidine-DNA glycosylase